MTLPPSAIVVLGALATRGPLTHKDLVASVPIPARTVRFALTRLRAAGRVIERPSFRDSRQSYYLLATGDAATETAVPSETAYRGRRDVPGTFDAIAAS